MKKEDVLGLVVYIIIFAFAIVFGLTVLREFQYGSGMNTGQFLLYMILAIFVGLIFNSLIFEAGHLLGAKIGRYDVISFCFLGFTFYKKDNKWKFKFASYNGLTGETKIVPKEDAKKAPNPVPYLSFGTLFFAIEIIVFVILFIALNNAASNVKTTMECKVAYFLLTVGVIGAMVLIYNIMPFQLDSVTDGYRLKLVSNPKNREAFNELLKVEHAIENGNTNVEVKTFDTITDFTADLNLNKIYVLLNNSNYKEAEELIDKIIDSKESVSEKVFIRAVAQKLYIRIMTSSIDEAKEYYHNNVPSSVTKAISEDVSMSSIRAYMLISGLLDNSRSETEIALNRVMKAFKKTSKARQATELKLYNHALEKIIEAHPTWELDGFLLQEVKEETKGK